MSLMDGRDFCLYCGKKIEKAYDWTIEGRPSRTYLHLDHMDPLSRGGKDAKCNSVYCCVTCNIKKRDKLFSDWLNELMPKYRRLSRSVYTAKHRREPEEFTPSASEIVVTIDLNKALRELEQLD